MITAFSTISLDNTLLNITGSGVLQVGPYQVVYTYQTGVFGASGNFYPLNSNPSGYITTGQTGAFGGGSTPTGNLTGVFYPLLSNPSGYITTGQTGSFGTAINTGSLTGQFYPLNSNPDNYITSLQTGTFITSSQTGAFASVINLGLTGNILQLEINSLNSWSGGSTGLYYPLSSNPLNYVNNIQSGSLTGQFYPLNSNPSNYVTTSQTGIFTSVAITGSVVQSYVNLSGISGILVSTGISGLVLFNGINFVQTSQTGAFASSINLNSTGSYLIGLINASSAGVSSLNSASGALTLVGTGNVSVSVAGETITISGNTGIYSSFITTGQTGAFYPLNSNPDNYITNIQTGTLTGQFYPLNSNPDNYITSAQTGNFITTNQTGIFTSVSITGVTVQSYINLSGISGILVSTGISGLVLFNGQNLVQISQTGTFITSSQTGAFSSAINLGITGNTLQLEINSLNNWTGNSTGLYYPYNSNPNAYITTGQTGAFGGGTTPTGNLTGAFYPLQTNPSGYATTQYVQDSIAGGQIYYLQSGADLITPKYFQLLDETPTNTANASISTSLTLSSGPILLTGFITPSGDPNMLQIPAGLWLFNLYGSCSSVTNTSYFINTIYSLGITGLETPLFSGTGSPLSTTTQLNSFYYTNTGINLNSGDRLISKIYADTNNALATTITLNYQGASTPSHISTPLNFGYTYYNNIFISQNQSGQFASAINLGITGNTLQLEINSLNSWTGGSDTLYYPLGTNPSNYITSSQTGIFTSVTVTGGLVQSYANLSGISGILVSTGISGLVLFNGLNLVQTSQTGAFITTGQTGTFGGGSTNTGILTGAFYPLNSNPSGYINVYNQSGAYIFNTNATNGVQNQFISFPANLGNNPYVISSINNLSGTESIFIQVTGITSSGYWAAYSNVIDSSNYYVTTIASLSTNTGLATTVIYQNIVDAISGGYASGNINYIYSPQPTISGTNISTIINWQNGDHFYVTLTGNTNVTFTGTQDAMTIMIASLDTGSAYNITFPTGNGNNFSGIKWQWGTGAVPIQTSGATDIYTFTQFNTRIYASIIQGY